jgi:hypothetical protein
MSDDDLFLHIYKKGTVLQDDDDAIWKVKVYDK